MKIAPVAALAVAIPVALISGCALVTVAAPSWWVNGDDVIVVTPGPPVGEVMALASAATSNGPKARLIGAALKSTPRGSLWVLERQDGELQALDARSGAPLMPLDRAGAVAAAAKVYYGEAPVRGARLYAQPPNEAPSPGAVWKIEYGDPRRTHVFVSAITGEKAGGGTRWSGAYRAVALPRVEAWAVSGLRRTLVAVVALAGMAAAIFTGVVALRPVRKDV